MSREKISEEGKRFYRGLYKPTDPIYIEGWNLVIRGNSVREMGQKKERKMSTQQNTDKELDNSRILAAKKRGRERTKRTLARLGTTKIGTNRKPHKPSGESFLFFGGKNQETQSSNNSKDNPYGLTKEELKLSTERVQRILETSRTTKPGTYWKPQKPNKEKKEE